MTAKEMFEKLGYEYRKFTNCIEYFNGTSLIIFDFDLLALRKTDKYYISDEYITIDESKAVNKQIEELGW